VLDDLCIQYGRINIKTLTCYYSKQAEDNLLEFKEKSLINYANFKNLP